MGVFVCLQEEEKKRKEEEKKAKENQNNEEVIIKHGGVMGDMPVPEKRPGKSQLWCLSGCFEASG